MYQAGPIINQIWWCISFPYEHEHWVLELGPGHFEQQVFTLDEKWPCFMQGKGCWPAGFIVYSEFYLKFGMASIVPVERQRNQVLFKLYFNEKVYWITFLSSVFMYRVLNIIIKVNCKILGFTAANDKYRLTLVRLHTIIINFWSNNLFNNRRLLLQTEYCDATFCHIDYSVWRHYIWLQ